MSKLGLHLGQDPLQFAMDEPPILESYITKVDNGLLRSRNTMSYGVYEVAPT